MPGCIVSATTASFNSVEKRRLQATPVITSTFENASDIGVSLGLCLGPPAIARVRSKRGALQGVTPLQVMLQVMREHLREAEKLPAYCREAWGTVGAAAARCAPYMHAKLIFSKRCSAPPG